MTCKIPTTPTIPAITQRAARVARALHQMRQAQSLAILASEIARYEANDEDCATLHTEFAEIAHDIASGSTPPVIANAAPPSGANCASCAYDRSGLDELGGKRSVMP